MWGQTLLNPLYVREMWDMISRSLCWWRVFSAGWENWRLWEAAVTIGRSRCVVNSTAITQPFWYSRQSQLQTHCPSWFFSVDNVIYKFNRHCPNPVQRSPQFLWWSVITTDSNKGNNATKDLKWNKESSIKRWSVYMIMMIFFFLIVYLWVAFLWGTILYSSGNHRLKGLKI